MQCNESNFIDKMRKKEETALEYVIDCYLPTVKGAVNAVLGQYGQREEMEECINDVFLSCWNHIHQFKGKDALSFKKWIYKIAKYKSIDFYRKYVAKRKEVSLEKCQEDGIEIGQISFEIENDKMLLKIIDTMQPLDKKIFIMRFLLGEKTEDIAKKLDMTKAAVDNRVYRSRKKVNHELQELEVY